MAGPELALRARRQLSALHVVRLSTSNDAADVIVDVARMRKVAVR